jgi:hypothetical protein
MRALRGAVVLMLVAGCATNGSLPRRTAPKVILGVLMVGSAALAVGAAIKSHSIENDLANDYKQREISGREFASRDSQGQRWNRIGRASAFVSGLSLLGLGVLWEMSKADEAQTEPSQPNQTPLFPLPAAMTLPRPGLPIGLNQMSADAR